MSFRKSILGLAVGACFSAGAGAAPIYIDAQSSFNGVDSDSLTEVFDVLTLNKFNPVSVYFDTDSSGGVSVDDFFVDIATVSVGFLNPTPSDTENYNSPDRFDLDIGDPGDPDIITIDRPAWRLDVSWVLFGEVNALVPTGLCPGAPGTNLALCPNPDPSGDPPAFPDSLVSPAFLGGEIGIDYQSVDVDGAVGAPTRILDIELEGAVPAAADAIALELFGEVTGAAPGYFFFADGTDFNELLSDIPPVKVGAVGDTEIRDLANPPINSLIANAGGQFTGAIEAATDFFCGLDEWEDFCNNNGGDQLTTFIRTTELPSANIGFERVPAPASLALMGIGLLALGRRMRRS